MVGLAFVCGVLAGAFAAIVLVAMLAAAGQADREWERRAR